MLTFLTIEGGTTDEWAKQWTADLLKETFGPILIEFGNWLLHALPEVFTITAMGFLLFGMFGSKSSMQAAGTCFLLALMGQVLIYAL